ncbi:unnamed protein product [Rhizoctonia solani]|uniref:DRBM domain-containing protein n=1 Tax=Rhizoctonia solani TaxID=456999 RepID=A0A8H3A629_9AGAM|nr:unnamed protein product [Rhizoctonia solani]
MSSTNTTTYRLNPGGDPDDRFDWSEAFETWQQRRRVHVNWTFNPVPASNNWSATVVLAGRTITGEGATKKKAKNNAVMNIERASILS